MKMHIEIVNTTGPDNECECCGTFNYSSCQVFVNGQEVWFSKTDNHLYKDESNISLKAAILDAFKDNDLFILDTQYTEENRIQWNIKYNNNYIASTPETWLADKNEGIIYTYETYDELNTAIDSLPPSIEGQVKIIAVWIEELTSNSVEISTRDEQI